MIKDQFIYKIFRPSEWQVLIKTGAFLGSADDKRDGFIHLSAARQVQGTLDKHYADVPDIILARINTLALGAALKWEVSRGGALFPHLYVELPQGAVQAHIKLVQTIDNGYQVPDDFLITGKRTP